MTDGKTKISFHNPDAGGWVHADYYVSYVGSRRQDSSIMGA